jgi:hypothetical protein
MNKEEEEKILEDAIELVSLAFLKTKSYLEMFRCEDNVELQLQMHKAVFSKIIRIAHAKYPSALHYFYENDCNISSVEGETQERKMICSFSFLPSNASFSLWEKIQFGLLKIPFEVGFKAFFRLLKAESVYAEKYRKHLNGRCAIEVGRMVVHPSCQGKGTGLRCLGNALKEEADKHELPVILSTQDERNVRFYSKL